MSESQGGAGRREVAWRVFAAEFEDATLEHSESDEERAPNYVITPTGARVNRLFAVGVLTEVESVTDDVLRGRIVDPTGAFVTYAGQYQPEAMAFLDNAAPPQFVAVTGKARTFQPEDSDLIYTSIRPESVNAVDAETRDRWTVQTAEQTLARVEAFETALDSRKAGADLVAYLVEEGVDESHARGISLALDHYGTTYDYLDAVRGMARDALRVVAGELDASDLDGLSVAPDEGEGVDVERSAAADPGAYESADEGAEETAETAEAEPTEADDAEPAEPGESETAEPEVEDAADAAEVGAPTDSEPEVESEEADVTDEQFEPETEADEDLGTGGAGAEMYEMDEEERREVEEEYGTEFSTGATIGEPGEADIETPTPDSEEDELTEEVTTGPGEPAPGPVSDEEATGQDAEQTGAEPEPEPAEDGEADGTEEPAAEAETGADEEEPEPEADQEAAEAEEEAEADEAGGTPDDLNAVVMEYMHDLDDGDGADRGALIAAVTGDYDVSEAAVEDAIEDALMGGQCYEANEDSLKPI